MRIVYHLGAHCTDEDRLVRCLLKNRAVLADQGIVVPSPTRYRRLLRDTAVQLRGMAASSESQSLLLEQIMEEPQAERLVLSWDSFLSFPAWAVRDGLYSFGGERIRAFSQVFSDHEAEFHLAIRNPATFLPALQEKVSAKGRENILADVDPFTLRWSDTVRQILVQNPGVPLTVWCDEETPLIGPEVIQSLSGHAPGTPMIDTDEILGLIMNEIGLARMRTYCTEHPPQGVAQRRRVVTAFLDRFARPDQVEVEVDVPGWSSDMVADLTDRYHRDVSYIRGMAGVKLIEA
jgi:hypothetical protein